MENNKENKTSIEDKVNIENNNNETENIIQYGPLIIGNLVAKVPVMQGGMGIGVSLSQLASAVAREGGIGIISTAQIGYRDPDFDQNPINTNLRVIREEVEKARKNSTNGIIGVNIMVATKEYDQYVHAALESGVDLIVSGAGLPMTLPKLAEGYDTKLVPIVSSVKSADVICKYWQRKYDRLPDAIVIEGPLAGGHLGFTEQQIVEYTTVTTTNQSEQTRESTLNGQQDRKNYDKEIQAILVCVHSYEQQYQVKIPVIVAGGIYDRGDMLHYLKMGAQGVQIATRFVTTYECDASPAFKQAYLDARKEDIVIVKSPVGMPGRAIRTAFMDRAAMGQIPHGKCHTCISTCKPTETPYCITEALLNAVKGNIDDALVFCGYNAYRADHLETVKEIMEEFKI